MKVVFIQVVCETEETAIPDAVSPSYLPAAQPPSYAAASHSAYSAIQQTFHTISQPQSAYSHSQAHSLQQPNVSRVPFNATQTQQYVMQNNDYYYEEQPSYDTRQGQTLAAQPSWAYQDRPVMQQVVYNEQPVYDHSQPYPQMYRPQMRYR